MTAADAQFRQLAARLVATEGGHDAAAAVVRLYETYFDRLAPVIGARGVRALFARAVEVEKTRHACLAALVLDGDPRAAALPLITCLSDEPPDAAHAAVVAVLAAFIGLIVNILGADLGARILGTELKEIR